MAECHLRCPAGHDARFLSFMYWRDENNIVAYAKFQMGMMGTKWGLMLWCAECEDEVYLTNVPEHEKRALTDHIMATRREMRELTEQLDDELLAKYAAFAEYYEERESVRAERLIRTLESDGDVGHRQGE